MCPRALLRGVAPCLTALALAACGGSDSGGTGPDPDDAVASVTVSPSSVTVDVGSSTQLQATVRNGRNEVVAASVSWTSSNPSVASVSGGTVTGLAEGEVTVTATASGRRGTAGVAVNDPFPPAAPGGLRVEAVSDTETELSWTDEASNEDEYRVEREDAGAAGSVGPARAFGLVATLGPDATSYRDTGLEPGHRYNYRVHACNENGCSDLPAPVEVETYETLVIETSSLPDGTKDVAYSHTLQASGGDGPPVWSVIAGTLPSGMTLGSDGILNGTPDTPGPYGFTVRAEGAGQAPTADYTLTVNDQILPPEVTTDALEDGGVGASYSVSLQASKGDGSYAWALTAGSLPAGLSLAADGALAGTPAAAGSFDITVEVTSAGVSGSADLTLVVHPALSVATADLPDGVEGQAYDADLVAGGGDGSTTWSLESGALPPGLALDADGSISGTPTEPPPVPDDGSAAVGTSGFTVRVESGVGQVATASLSITVNGVLEITTTALADGQVGSAYKQTVIATGGDGTNTWSLTGGALPGGLTLDAGTGTVSGTPTTAGTFNFTVQAQSGDGQAAAANLSIDVAVAPVTVTTTSLPNGAVGAAYGETLQASGGDGVSYTWSVSSGSLPTDLSLNAATGVISGTPSAAGTFNFTVEATSGGQTDDQALSIAITSGAAVTIETNFLSGGHTGTPYSDAVAAGGGTGSYSFSVTAGALPPGLSLNASTGAVTGTPASSGVFHFTVEAASGGSSAAHTYMLTVSTQSSAAFNVFLHNISGTLPSAAVQTALNTAVAKLENAVTGDVPGFFTTLFDQTFCSGWAVDFNGVAIDDVEIFMDIQSIDGGGGTLASAGPCAIATRAGRTLPILGIMTMDSDDLGSLDGTQLPAVILHEMLHVMGIGTLWATNGFVTGAGGVDPRYTGADAVTQYTGLGGLDADIAVANTGGSGTRDVHWRELTFNAELMTGYAEGPGIAQPFSAMTIGGLSDLGWVVDLGAAEAYAIPGPPPAGTPSAESGTPFDTVWDGPVAFFGADGTLRAVIRPPE